MVRIAGVQIEVANGITRRRQISPSVRSGIPSAFSRNCLAGSSQSISGQKSRGALCRAESGWKRMPTSRCIPTEQYYIGKTVPGAWYRPCHVFVDISKLLVAAPVRSLSSLSSPPFPIANDKGGLSTGNKTPLALNPCLRISRKEDGGEISATVRGWEKSVTISATN